MKSEPELAELIEAVEGVEVTMAEKGFGTRVEIRAGESTGLDRPTSRPSSTASRSRSDDLQPLSRQNEATYGRRCRQKASTA